MKSNDINDATGEYALWDKGKLIGYAAVAMVDGRKVLASTKKVIEEMKAAAAKDNILLTLNSGFRTWGEQYALRKRYRKAFEDDCDRRKVKFEVRVNDEHFILTASSSNFLPACAPPGWSNHQDGMAFDFKVRDDPETKQNEALAYGWLIKHAISFGFVRTVKSERWHWEKRDIADMFAFVPKTDPSWDGLV